MPSSYTPLLRLTLPADGELVGTWGQTVNNGITSLEEAAIAGTASVALADADYVMSTANGAADVARNAVVRFTGALTAQRNITVPSSSKTYIIRNDTTGGFGLNVKTAAGAGVVVPAGQAMLVYCNGVDVMQAFTTLGTGGIDGTPDLILKASGAEKARLTAAGDLQFVSLYLPNGNVFQAGAQLSQTFNDNSGAAQAAVYFARNASTFGGGVRSSSELRFATTGSSVAGDGSTFSDKMVITGIGRVGIGTMAPSAALEVARGAGVGAELVLRGNNAAYTAGFSVNSNATNQAILFNRANTDMIFGTSNTERMRLDAAGNVGIGTTNPTSKLFVEGTSISGSNIAISINNLQSTMGGSLAVTGTTFNAGGVGGGEMALISNGTLTLGNINANFPTKFVNNGAERMRILATGNIIIGGVSPIGTTGSGLTIYSGSIGLSYKNTNTTSGKSWSVGPDGGNAYTVYNQGNVGVYLSDGATAWTANSDERDKADFTEFADATTKIASLRAGLGRYTHDAVGTQRAFLIAQEVQAVLPSAVSVAPNPAGDPEREGFLGLAYTDMIPLLVAAIKELNQRLVAIGA